MSFWTTRTDPLAGEPHFTSQQVFCGWDRASSSNESLLVSSHADACLSLRERVLQRSGRAQVAESLQPAVFSVFSTGRLWHLTSGDVVPATEHTPTAAPCTMQRRCYALRGSNAAEGEACLQYSMHRTVQSMAGWAAF